MKTCLVTILLLMPAFSMAQPDLESLQQQWIQTLKSGEAAADFYWENRNFTYAEIDSTDSKNFIRLVQSKDMPEIKNYEHEQIFRHDDYRYISAGYLTTKENELLLLTGWRNVEDNWKKEIDVILSRQLPAQKISEELHSTLDAEREKWVKLANEHNPEVHITASYTNNAAYFGNGQKSEGRAEIADRYFYMENPNYQVDLEKERLWEISDQKILEVGRYFTGTERIGSGGLYVILWEKQKSKNWQIVLDFNF